MEESGVCSMLVVHFSSSCVGWYLDREPDGGQADDALRTGDLQRRGDGDR